MYRQLDASKIVLTAETLRNRIAERFPESGLSKVAAEVLSVAQEAIERLQWIKKPQKGLRLGVYLLMAGVLAVLFMLLGSLERPNWKEPGNFIQVLEAGLSAMFFIGASVLFLLTWEGRIKRTKALRAIHELRAMSHIVDMHQLTKDPDALRSGRGNTASSPARTLTAPQLSRYLDYCSELLSLISKIAALYAQGLEDPVVLSAVDDVEDLCAELSQKVWQKITILDAVLSREGRGAGTIQAGSWP